MELIIIAIIGVVLIISICICICILGQTLMAKRRQPNQLQSSSNTDTLHPRAGQYGDGGHIMTSSWMCSYPGEKPSASPHIWETPLPMPCADQSEGEYTLPANMRHAQDKADPQADLVAEPVLSENIQSVSNGDYSAPITLNANEQQHAVVVPPQPIPEYTLPIKKEMRQSSPAHSTEVPAAEDDYLLPSAGRPEPVGANEVQKPSGFEGSSLKNVLYRPDSTLTEDAQECINMNDDTANDALLQ